MKIKLTNNVEYEVCDTGSAATRVEPSSNPAVRGQMYIYMAEDAMPLPDFIELFTTKENLTTITMLGDDFEAEFNHYIITQSVGKELVVEVDSATGAVSERYCLVAKLEQLTYIEQQLAALIVQ